MTRVIIGVDVYGWLTEKLLDNINITGQDSSMQWCPPAVVAFACEARYNLQYSVKFYILRSNNLLLMKQILTAS